jgi:hypothetical protein
MEGLCDSCKVLDEPLVEVSKANECVNIAEVLQLSPSLCRGNLSQVHMDLPFQDDHAKILNFGLLKIALFRVQVQIIVTKVFEYLACNTTVLLKVKHEDENIIKIHSNFALSNKVSKDGVHHPLECCWGICDPKEHNHGFEQAVVGSKHSFPFIPFLDLYVIVAPAYIKLCEVASTMQLVDNVQCKREQVAVLDQDVVKLPVVLDETKLSILLA